MTKENKKVLTRMSLISILVLLVEFFILNYMGVFYGIILSICGLKYIKNNNLFGAKIVVMLLLAPAIISLLLVIKNLIAY
jgi:membrane-anchored glycerophosphoryl diester phosphodiesterase (GDPDase)